MSSQVCSPVLVIRRSSCADVQYMIPLMRQLRYPTTVNVLKERLAMLENHEQMSCLVAELDGKVVGTVFLKQHQTHDMSKPVTLITALIVDDQHRGQGIGRRLLDEAERWGAVRHSSQLHVSIARESSFSSKPFYERCGFVSAGYHLSKTVQG